MCTYSETQRSAKGDKLTSSPRADEIRQERENLDKNEESELQSEQEADHSAVEGRATEGERVESRSTRVIGSNHLGDTASDSKAPPGNG